MFYHAQWPVDLLTPVYTLSQCADAVNYNIKVHGKDLSQWTHLQQDAVARLLWVNWIYQHLGVEPIRKPVLTHLEAGHHVVDCGDTRLMALNLLLDPSTVSVVCTVPVDQAAQFSNWIPVRSNQDLVQVTGFSDNATVLVRAGIKQAIEWLEIGDNTTAHHLHSIAQRVSMMQNYLDRHPSTVFDMEWARNYIDWDRYAS